MTKRLRNNPTVFVGVPTPTLIYVGIADREDFDRIAVRCVDHGEREDGHVLSKMLKSGKRTVIFQHWIKSLTLEALWADFKAQKG